MENNNIDAIGFIPARFASTRLPGKPLVDICGKPLLQRVWEAACRSTILRRIIVATDDDRIAELCFNIGAEYLLTPNNINSGSDRILYSYNQLQEEAPVILNIQGDEPMLTGNLIDKLITSFIQSKADAGTLIKRIRDENELFDPGIVKVVINIDNFALYFSRSVIPYVRDVQKEGWLYNNTFWKHIGIYAYKIEVLKKFSQFEPSELEIKEKLEQLRLLQNKQTIYCLETDLETIGVDTPEDLEKVRLIFSS